MGDVDAWYQSECKLVCRLVRAYVASFHACDFAYRVVIDALVDKLLTAQRDHDTVAAWVEERTLIDEISLPVGVARQALRALERELLICSMQRTGPRDSSKRGRAEETTDAEEVTDATLCNVKTVHWSIDVLAAYDAIRAHLAEMRIVACELRDIARNPVAGYVCANDGCRRTYTSLDIRDIMDVVDGTPHLRCRHCASAVKGALLADGGTALELDISASDARNAPDVFDRCTVPLRDLVGIMERRGVERALGAVVKIDVTIATRDEDPRELSDAAASTMIACDNMIEIDDDGIAWEDVE